jgi:hypothetical protein
MIVCGGFLGGIGGFGFAVSRIARGETRIWSPAVWIGAGVGLAIGLLLSFRTEVRLEPWFWCIRAAFFASACSAVGALVARVGAAMLKQPSKRR